MLLAQQSSLNRNEFIFVPPKEDFAEIHFLPNHIVNKVLILRKKGIFQFVFTWKQFTEALKVVTV